MHSQTPPSSSLLHPSLCLLFPHLQPLHQGRDGVVHVEGGAGVAEAVPVDARIGGGVNFGAEGEEQGVGGRVGVEAGVWVGVHTCVNVSIARVSGRVRAWTNRHKGQGTTSGGCC